jgi:hypothetical protein
MTFEVFVDKFYIDGVIKSIKDINGIYCQCNLDSDASTKLCCPPFIFDPYTFCGQQNSTCSTQYILY